jgi:hypothetical protein
MWTEVVFAFPDRPHPEERQREAANVLGDHLTIRTDWI